MSGWRNISVAETTRSKCRMAANRIFVRVSEVTTVGEVAALQKLLDFRAELHDHFGFFALDTLLSVLQAGSISGEARPRKWHL